MLRTTILEERQEILEQGIAKGMEKGMEKGVVIGAEKTSIEVAERGVKNGLSNEMIHSLTGLSIKKIKEIRKKLEQH